MFSQRIHRFSMFHLLILPLLMLSLSLSVLSVNGCQTMAPTAGASPPTALQTFDALYASAVSADDLVIRTATTALASGFINGTQATTILHVTDSVKAALDLANAAAQTGNAGVATGNLASALGPIAILSACLTQKPLTATTFGACAVKLTPAVQS
jgi:hypothetical protein